MTPTNRTAAPYLNRPLDLPPCTSACLNETRSLWQSPHTSINVNQSKRPAAEIEDDDPTDVDDSDIATGDEETTCTRVAKKSLKKRRTFSHTIPGKNAAAVGRTPTSSRHHHPPLRHSEDDIFTTPLKDKQKNDLISELFSASPASKSMSSLQRTKNISFDLGLITPPKPRSASFSGIHTPSRLTLSDYLVQSERGAECGVNIWHETTNLLDMLDTEVLKSELYRRGYVFILLQFYIKQLKHNYIVLNCCRRDATRKIAQNRADEIVAMKTRTGELEAHETCLKKRVDELEASEMYLKKRVNELEASEMCLKIRVDELEAHEVCLEERIEELEAEKEITKQVNEGLRSQLQLMRINSQDN